MSPPCPPGRQRSQDRRGTDLPFPNRHPPGTLRRRDPELRVAHIDEPSLFGRQVSSIPRPRMIDQATDFSISVCPYLSGSLSSRHDDKQRGETPVPGPPKPNGGAGRGRRGETRAVVSTGKSGYIRHRLNGKGSTRFLFTDSCTHSAGLHPDRR